MTSKSQWRNSAILTAALLILLCVSQEAALAGPTQALKRKGDALLEKAGCFQCHYMLGKGGLIGPPFEGIGKFRSEADIVGILTSKRTLPPYYPKGLVDPAEFMRHVRLDKKTAQEIAKYLITTPAEDSFEVRGHGEDDSPHDAKLGTFSFKPHKPSEASRKGLISYKKAGCAACHITGGMGGRRGPDLDGIGARLNKSSIENRIAGGALVFVEEREYKTAEYLMPPAKLSKKQVAQITEFLLTLPKNKAR
jgi:cytochrome c2